MNHLVWNIWVHKNVTVPVTRVEHLGTSECNCPCNKSGTLQFLECNWVGVMIQSL